MRGDVKADEKADMKRLNREISSSDEVWDLLGKKEKAFLLGKVR